MNHFLEMRLARLVDKLIVLVELGTRLAKRAAARDDAVYTSFSLIARGVPMARVTAISVHVGETVYVKINPEKADGSPDLSVENVIRTVNGGAAGDGNVQLAPYGDGSDPLKFAVKGLAAGPGDAPLETEIAGQYDSNTEVGGEQVVEFTLPVTVLAENAVATTFDTIEAPPA